MPSKGRLGSVIIPCWNQREFTRHCIAALARHTRDPWELIVVDNGSTDGTNAFLEGVQAAAPFQVQVITNPENRGFPAACNQGLQAARGDFLVLLNNDAVVTDGWLDQLRFLGAAILGVFFEGGTASAKERRREDLGMTFREFHGNRVDLPTREILRREIGQAASVLDRVEPPVKPFHWEIEFPEVFLAPEKDGSLGRPLEGGFDAIVGNPPFTAGTNISLTQGESYRDWLYSAFPESGNRMDLVAYFFRRSFSLICFGGSLGLIATNSIAQGDTRKGGLRYICHDKGVIYDAMRRLRWPGIAAVVVSVVHVCRGECKSQRLLDGNSVGNINAFLFDRGGHDDPQALIENSGLTFEGYKPAGQGFLFDDDDPEANPMVVMHRLMEDERNRSRIFPFIGGEEVNSSPSHTPRRYAIDFDDFSLEMAGTWSELLEIVETKVKPYRDSVKRDAHRIRWWQYGERRPGLRKAIAGLERIMCVSRVGDKLSFAFLPGGMIYSEALVIFPTGSYAFFGLLQSRPHELWARFFGSSMKDDLRYTPSDCFETFPFPEGWETRGELEAIGRQYYEYRARLMIDSNKGLTKTYNRFHDPKERAPEIARLRELHSAMDRAVLASYG
ncbi:glycosyltransferase, partial [Singulisphaera rosea]